MKINQSGRSMIEMLGVLAIIGVLSVGGIAGYSKAMAKYRSNKMIEQVSMLITNIRTMYAQQQTYSGLNNRTAIEMGVVPEELIVQKIDSGEAKPTGALRNVFGGPIQILESSVDGSGSSLDDKSAFIISSFNMSRDACVAIATSDWGAGSSSGLLGMHVYVTGQDAVAVVDSAVEAAEDGTITTPAALDTNGEKMSKADTGGTNTGYAIPGDPTVGVPMRVEQARIVCSCTDKADCAITWKYY